MLPDRQPEADTKFCGVQGDFGNKLGIALL